MLGLFRDAYLDARTLKIQMLGGDARTVKHYREHVKKMSKCSVHIQNTGIVRSWREMLEHLNTI